MTISGTDRETLRLEQLDFTGLPGSLLLNLVVAAVVGLVGGVQYWGSFSPIRLADNPRWEGSSMWQCCYLCRCIAFFRIAQLFSDLHTREVSLAQGALFLS